MDPEFVAANPDSYVAIRNDELFGSSMNYYHVYDINFLSF